MAISAEHRWKFAALYRKWWRLQILNEEILEWDENTQTWRKVFCYKKMITFSLLKHKQYIL